MSMPTFDADAGGALAADLAGGNAGDPYVPDETGRPDDTAGRSMLDVLVADLAGAEPVEELPPIALKRNPSYIVVYSKITDGDVIDKARKASRDKSKADGIDGPKFAGLICGSACARIIRNGVVLTDDADRPLRFNHRMLLQALNAATVADCARRFYADDADMDAVARKIMTDSGWGEDAAEADFADPRSAG